VVSLPRVPLEVLPVRRSEEGALVVVTPPVEPGRRAEAEVDHRVDLGTEGGVVVVAEGIGLTVGDRPVHDLYPGVDVVEVEPRKERRRHHTVEAVAVVDDL